MDLVSRIKRAYNTGAIRGSFCTQVQIDQYYGHKFPEELLRFAENLPNPNGHLERTAYAIGYIFQY